jgi:hypothetical protein
VLWLFGSHWSADRISRYFGDDITVIDATDPVLLVWALHA